MWDTLILNPMINILLWIYSVIGDFGVAIILFTLLIRLITHPLTVSQLQAQQKMTDFQQSKEWLDIQKKYKDDKQQLQVEQARLMQEKGFNPAASCLPLVIQLPIIFGLYQAIVKVLAVTPVQLLDLALPAHNHVYPFINVANLLPVKSTFLWMELSVSEQVGGLGLPLLGFGLPLLTALVVITQFIQTKAMTPATPPGGDPTAQSMTKAMNLYMPLFMGWISYTLPQGLALYFLVTNLFGVLQYAALGKLNWRNLLPGGAKAEPAKAQAGHSAGKSKGKKS